MDSKKIIKKIFNNSNEDFDAILIRNGSESSFDNNFFYITGLEKGLFENCSIIIYPDGDAKLIVSKLEAGLAKKTPFELFIYNNQNDYKNIIKKCLKNSKKVGLNFNNTNINFYNLLNKIFLRKDFINITESLNKSRSIKEEYEINRIKYACKITDKVAKKIPDFIKIGMKEYELAAEIDYQMQKNGAEKPAFLTITSFGKNTANPHYSHGNNKLKKKDIILCDFGACFKKYNSDMTRCFVLGETEKKIKEMYKIVLKAQEIGINKIKEGIKANIIHNVVNDFINKTKYKGCFVHSTGHSLGLEVHDPGVGFNSECDVFLEENMVLTVEPGLYKEKIGGIRIEDDIIIKKDKAVILNKATKKLIEI